MSAALFSRLTQVVMDFAVTIATGARWSEAEGLTPARLRDGLVTYSKT